MSYEDENGQPKKKAWVWIVVVIAVVAVIGIPALLLRGADTGNDTEAELTLAEVSAQLQTARGQVSTLENRTAGQSESIADLNTKLNALETQIANLDVSGDIDDALIQIEAEWEDLKAEFEDISWDIPAYAQVTRVEEAVDTWPDTTLTYVDVITAGAGEYQVVVSVVGYHSGNSSEPLDVDMVEVRYPGEYKITEAWFVETSGGTFPGILQLVITPTDEWDVSSLIELKVSNGVVCHAYAVIAAGHGTETPEW